LPPCFFASPTWASGFSLHAGVRCAAEQRQALEHLCRYITRPVIANERVSVNHAGQVVLKLKTPYRDGTSHIVMSPLEFMQRLAALVPRPRLHLIRFHGVLAPHARLRAAIVPTPAPTAHAADCAHAPGASMRMSWARLLKRVFDIDIERCPQCGAWNFVRWLDTRTRGRWEGSACARAREPIEGNRPPQRARFWGKQRGLREWSRR
jgi:hypothetical protein